MKLKGSLFITSILLLLGTGTALATLYCNRSYQELKPQLGRPYNAVGYLNNGCTAFLIDANHIVAAAHCFADIGGTGAWQTGLRFYPSFHPDRVISNEKQVPRGDVTRVVVGSRAGEGMMGSGIDWGIARIEHWKDTSGIDLTPINLASTIPPLETPLVNPAYTRHHFPFDDNDAVTWDNMEWDTKYCNWVGESAPGKKDGGMWALKMHTAPIFDGAQRDNVGCNVRWAAGMIHENCSLKKLSQNLLFHNCDTVGGSSGSPILYQNNQGQWEVIGVGHGGGAADFSQKTPLCTTDNPNRWDNVAASVERFRDAPRFASNVAIHRRPDQTAATAVFAIDQDLNQVAYRYRMGANPSYQDQFSFWKSLGKPEKGARLSNIATCSANKSGQPQIFVISNGKILTRLAHANGRWTAWMPFGEPTTTLNIQEFNPQLRKLNPILNNEGIEGNQLLQRPSQGNVLDIDASTDANGNCLIFVVTRNGAVFVRSKATDASWNSWTMITDGNYRKVTAINYEGAISLAMLDTNGDIWKSILDSSVWTTPQKLSLPANITAWQDMDFTWDELGRGFLLATPEQGGNLLYFTPLYGANAWQEWRYFTTHLWTPNQLPQDAPKLLSITASRWMEDSQGTTSPVVFATDEDGNIYFIEYSRLGNPEWKLDWKSFYHEFIPHLNYQG